MNQGLPSLENVTISRCILPPNKEVLKQELHHFADAFTHGYEVVSYLRTVDVGGKVQCCFLFGRARLAPVKTVSTLRLDLTAATLAAKVDEMLKTEMTCKTLPTVFWTDSTASCT